MNIAEESIVVEVVKPYWGWKEFSKLIFEVVSELRSTNLVGEPQRASLRYQNVISTEPGLAALKLNVEMGGYKFTEHGFQLRAEINNGGLLSIVNISGQAKITLRHNDRIEVLSGLYLDIDTIKKDVDQLWSDYEAIISNIHDSEKEVFFSLLTPEAINNMDPEWD